MSYINKIEKIYNKKLNQVIFSLYVILFFIVIFFTLFFILLIYAVVYKLLAYLMIIILTFLTFSLFVFVAINFFGKKIDDNNASFGKGLLAEEKVISFLSALDDRYKIIPSFPKGEGDIDCVVVGPTGIFVIEVKANSGSVYYFKNNIRRLTEYGEKFIKQAAKNSQYLHDLLYKELGVNHRVYGLVVRPNRNDEYVPPFKNNQVCVLDGKIVVNYIKNVKRFNLDLRDIETINSFLWRQKRLNEYK